MGTRLFRGSIQGGYFNAPIYVLWTHPFLIVHFLCESIVAVEPSLSIRSPASTTYGIAKYETAMSMRETNLNQFQMSKANLTESGFEPETSGLTYQRSYQLSYPALYWRSPKFSWSFIHLVATSRPKRYLYLLGDEPLIAPHGYATACLSLPWKLLFLKYLYAYTVLN